MTDNIKLSSILNSPEFLKRIVYASLLSHQRKRETGFITYTDEHFTTVKNNIPLAYEKKFIDDKSDKRKGYGFTVELYCPSRIYTHFHPPGSIVIPSFDDLMKLHSERLENRQLGETCDSDKYSNPLGVVGLFKDPKTIDIFFYQEMKKYLFEREIIRRLSEAYKKTNPKADMDETYLMELDAFGMANIIIPRNKERMVNLLESSGAYVAEGITIQNGKIKEADLEKLVKFDENQFEIVPKDFEDDPDLDC